MLIIDKNVISNRGRERKRKKERERKREKERERERERKREREKEREKLEHNVISSGEGGFLERAASRIKKGR